jgi:hypothetical protein
MEKRRICRLCNNEKNLTDFANAGIVNNIKYYRHVCIPCYTETKKPRRLNIRNKYKEYKKTLKCSKCGFADYRALQFHHVDDNKNFNIASSINGSHGWNTILEEIKKCEVLCANCHQIEHYKDGNVV